LKRLFDVVSVLAALCILLPLLLVLALLVRVIDGSPVLYRETRLGRGGVPFTIFKFRTLRVGSAVEPRIAPEDDPRITNLGRWLRRWRFDEFPTLLNVLRGDMSLVGPRPLPAAVAERVATSDRDKIFTARPGITDPAAIHFVGEDAALVGRQDAEIVFYQCLLPARIRMSVAAIESASFAGDLRVLVQTLALLWSPRARQASSRAVHKLLTEHLEHA
jgi:lipopolysaccharide/colanic/teichoic acid biosynthesis glycosyltransferase